MFSRRASLPKCISPTATSTPPAASTKPSAATAKQSSEASEPQSNNSQTGPMTAPSPAKTDASLFSKDTAIKVVIRVRPLSEKELLARSPVVVSVAKTSVQVINPALFTDPTFLDAISTPAQKCSVGNMPIALSVQALTTATQAGECRSFHFDRCFGVDNAAANESEPFANAYDIDTTTQRPNQELVFEEIGKDMIPSAFQGFNCTVFAYGQTGSGKTHTMVGEKTTLRGKGVIPRVCEALFQGIEARRFKENELVEEMETVATAAIETGTPPSAPTVSVKKTVFTVQMSYCEIYKEKVFDLLDSSMPPSPTASFMTSTGPDSPSAAATATRGKVLKVREHPMTGPFVEGLSTRLVHSFDEIAEEMLAGDKLRTVAATLMNAVSSRSHALFTLSLTQTTFDAVTNVPTVKTSKISMIDLAGSERANVSGTSGDRLKEGAMINKSLTTLGRVIAALSKASGSGNERIPYRDSTLTWLLKESLGGNAKTTMIAMVSPAAENYEETMSTLRYAESAKRVMNRAVVNEDPNARVIRQLREEIQQLKLELATREREAFYLVENIKDKAALPPQAQDRDKFYHAMQEELSIYRHQVDTLQKTQLETEEHRKKASRVWRLHAEYPSLVTTKPLASVVSHDVLVYTLGEGMSLVGSEEPAPKPSTAVTQAEPQVSPTTTATGGKSPRRLARNASWAGSFLKRRKSSASSEVVDTEAESGSPRQRKPLLSRRSSNPATGEADPLADEPTSSLCLQGGGVHAKHAVLVMHSRFVPPPDDVEQEDEIEYVVEVQPFAADAAVTVNDTPIRCEVRTQLNHGDVVGFGDRHWFRLHVPQVATMFAVSSKQDNAVSSTSVEELVHEANAICDQWNLNMEFSSTETSGGDVLVKKHLGAKRFSVVQWSTEILQDKVAFLRQFAASLQVNDGDVATVEEEEGEEHVEPFHDKLSAAREADALSSRGESESDADDSRSTDTRHVKASMSVMDGRASTTVEPSYPVPANASLSMPTPSVRLLGHARVYLTGTASDVDMLDPKTLTLTVGVFDVQGDQIARLYCKLSQLRSSDVGVGADKKETTQAKRGFSFLSSRASMTAANTTTTTTGGQAQPHQLTRVSIEFTRVEFLSPSLAAERISLTLKKWSRAIADDAPGESTPKVSPGTDGVVFELGHSLQIPTAVTTVGAECDDYVGVEVWGFGEAPSLLLTPTPTQRIELFVSVDVEERDADGFFRPVAVKSDGTLRLHVQQPRRVVLRVTQADHSPCILQGVGAARLSHAFSTRGASSIALGDGKSVQSLLLPPSAASTSIDVDELPTFQDWQPLFPRATCEVDAASRSLSVSLRWEVGAGSEGCDEADSRTVFRLAVAVQTSVSTVPVVVAKSIVTKMSSSEVSSSQRLAREWESSRTAWWARESFSRSYRLGTWYSVEVAPTLSRPTPSPIDAEYTNRSDESPTAVAQIDSHITGLRRLELCVAMERVRQAIATTYATTRISDEYPLTLERAQECFELLRQQRVNGEDASQPPPPLMKVLQLDDGALYLRHKANKEIFVAIETGDVKRISDTDAGDANAVSHVTHFVSEPTVLAGDGSMSGFLMFSTSVQLDESAIIGANASNVNSNPLTWAKHSLSNRLSWERRWFVLKRPFLYAYKSFARKEQIGVLDVARCQLVVPASSSARRPSMPGGHATTHSNSSLPFCFQLVSVAGGKCIVWSLQASTPAELRAWLVAIDPLKIDAREAVVQNTSQHEGSPIATA